MKYFLAGLFLPFGVFGQTITVNEMDKFTKERIIQTAVLPLKSSATEGMSLQFRSEGAKLFVVLSGHGRGAATIGIEDKALFLLANDSVIAGRSIGVQTYERDNDKNVYQYQYSLSHPSLEELTTYAVASIRIYNYKGYNDFDLPAAKGEEVKKWGLLFYKTLVKEKVILKLNPISLPQVSAHIGDSVLVSGKVTGVSYTGDSTNRVALLYLGAPYPKHYLTLIVPVIDSATEAFKEAYTNKVLTVSGRIVLQNKEPQIQVYSKEQLFVNTPVKLQEIGNYIGDSVLVYGRVLNEQQIEAPAGNFTILNIGEDFTLLTVAIQDRNKNGNTTTPEYTYKDKVVRIRGRVQWNNGKPEISVNNRGQID
jgi:hypothetical protein